MPEPATLEERIQKLVEDLDRRAKHLEALECPRIPGSDDWWPVPSAQIVLEHDRLSLAGPVNLAALGPVLLAGTGLTLTLTEPGYIWVWYRAVARYKTDVARQWYFELLLYMDGAGWSQPAQFGSWNPNRDVTVAVFDRSDLLAAGPHTVELYGLLNNAADAVDFYYMVGICFWVSAS